MLANLGQFFDLDLKRHPLSLSAQMLSAYFAHDSKEPGFKWPRGFVGMPRLIHRDHRFLTDIFDLTSIRHAPAQKTRDEGSDISKQKVKGFTISALSLRHELRSAEIFCVIQSHYSVNYAKIGLKLRLNRLKR